MRLWHWQADSLPLRPWEVPFLLSPTYNLIAYTLANRKVEEVAYLGPIFLVNKALLVSQLVSPLPSTPPPTPPVSQIPSVLFPSRPLNFLLYFLQVPVEISPSRIFPPTTLSKVALTLLPLPLYSEYV